VSAYPNALGELLGRAIDYAGMFPPAKLSLDAAVANYQSYASGPNAWALGRLVLPAARLPELRERFSPQSVRRLPLSVTLAADIAADLDLVDGFIQTHRDGARVECLEAKLVPDQLTAVAARLHGRVGYCEVPTSVPDGVLGAIREVGLRAKIRMGGVTREAFPPVTAVAEFIVRVLASGIRFKATAGLHHPLRGRYRLSYRSDSPCGPMFGYLNLMAASLAAAEGASPEQLVSVLEDPDPGHIRFSADGLQWRDRFFSLAAIRRFRARFDGFGSCSFSEPIDELSTIPASS